MRCRVSCMMKESFPPQYTAQPWPNANKVSKYLRDLCEAFRRLDRGQSLSYQHHRPAQQPHTSRPKVSGRHSVLALALLPMQRLVPS
jgi:hypothetical protein